MPSRCGKAPPNYTASRMISFGSLVMPAITAGAFVALTWVATKGLFFFLQESPSLNATIDERFLVLRLAF
jgi:hypothetical protein